MSFVALALVLAAGEPSSGYLLCSGLDSSSGHAVDYVGEPVHGSAADIDAYRRAFAAEVAQRYGVQLPSAITHCSSAETWAEAKEGFDYAKEYPIKHGGELVVVKWSGDRGQDWPSRADKAVDRRKRATAPASSHSAADEVAPSASPHRSKMTNAEADAKFAADKAAYQRKLAENAAEYKAAQKAVEMAKAAQQAAAQRALADYQRQLQTHDAAVLNQQRQAEAAQLEYQKMAAKPAGVPDAVYRGFWARDCAAARFSATNGAGTSAGTKFKEVHVETAETGCTVQGWWWNTSRTGASRQ